MKTRAKNEDIEGGSPSKGGIKDKNKHKDDSLKSPKVLQKESVKESESENMTGKKGYNETPPTVPVKSTKQ
jgi:hypothetical protein